MSEGKAWAARWPAHCKACGGWGGAAFWQSHGEGPSEQMFDPCDAPANLATCHRCGEPGLNPDDGGGPCSACGWNYDDGVPEPEDSGPPDGVREE